MASDPPKDLPVEGEEAIAEAPAEVEPAALPVVAGIDVAAALVEMDARVAAAALQAALAGDSPAPVAEVVDAAPKEPPEPVSPAKEWAAAVALMIVFAFICATFISMLRS
jgi:hypothetical protein